MWSKLPVLSTTQQFPFAILITWGFDKTADSPGGFGLASRSLRRKLRLEVRSPPIPLIQIRLSAFSRRKPLTAYWDNGFHIACASSACDGKSELGLNVAAPEARWSESASWCVCAAGYALQADRRVNGCVRTGRFRLRQELLRQIAVPMEGVDFAP
jgi:hypothetical protein